MSKSLTIKLASLPVLALFGLLAFLGYTYSKLSTNDQRLTDLESVRYPTLEYSDAIIFQFSRIPQLLNNAVSSGEMTALEEARKISIEISGNFEKLRDVLPKSSEMRLTELRAWKTSIQKYESNSYMASERLISGKADFEALSKDFSQMADDLAIAKELSEKFRQGAYEDFEKSLAMSRTDNAETIRVGIFITILLAAFVAFCAWIVISGVMRNIRGVILSLEAISKGDGDLTRRVDVQANDEIGVMVRGFNAFIEKLHRTMSLVIDSAKPLTQMSQDLYSLTRTAEAHAVSQNDKTESIGRDILTMTNSIEEVARRSLQASNEANAVSHKTDHAKEKITALSSGITDLGNSVIDASNAMNQLQNETLEVGKVLTVIHSIAEQTNLLALNAAIEAARAGDQGRGFAVVADEVRSLAQKTANSTAEINQIIERLQQSSKAVLKIMTINGDKAQASMEHSCQAAEMLSTIADAVRQINALNADIADLTQQQIGISESIQKDTRILQEDGQATAQSAESTSRLGKQLVETGDNLKTATSQFSV
jgi:methyl-accepting chemotaxis protein